MMLDVLRETAFGSGYQPLSQTPLRVEQIFHRSCIADLLESDVYNMIHNNNKVTVIK